MIDDEFEFAWPDYCDVVVDIEWTKPALYDFLFAGEMEEDDTAYFYSIVSRVNRDWLPFYIGMTHAQTPAARNKQPDHKRRFNRLKEEHPNLTFGISLGTPKFHRGRLSKALIGKIEGLLIYTHAHELMINDKKTEKFSFTRQIYVRNIGWREHLEPEVAYGVFYRGA